MLWVFDGVTAEAVLLFQVELVVFSRDWSLQAGVGGV